MGSVTFPPVQGRPEQQPSPPRGVRTLVPAFSAGLARPCLPTPTPTGCLPGPPPPLNKQIPQAPGSSPLWGGPQGELGGPHLDPGLLGKLRQGGGWEGALAAGLPLAEGQEAPAELGICGPTPGQHRHLWLDPYGFPAPVGTRDTLWGRPYRWGPAGVQAPGCRSWRLPHRGFGVSLPPPVGPGPGALV